LTGLLGPGDKLQRHEDIVEHLVVLLHILGRSQTRDPYKCLFVLVKYNNDVHPQSRVFIIRLDEKVIGVRHLALEFSFLQYLNPLLIFGGATGSFLYVGDTVTEFLEMYAQRVLDGRVRSDMNSRPEVVDQVRGLKDYIIISFRFI